MKDHQIAQLTNLLRDTAIEYRDAEQLRERIARIITPLMKQYQQDLAKLDHARGLLRYGADAVEGLYSFLDSMAYMPADKFAHDAREFIA